MVVVEQVANKMGRVLKILKVECYSFGALSCFLALNFYDFLSSCLRQYYLVKLFICITLIENMWCIFTLLSLLCWVADCDIILIVVVTSADRVYSF